MVFEYGFLILCLTNSTNTGYNGDPLDIDLDPIPYQLSVGTPFPNPFNNNVVFPINNITSDYIKYSILDISGKQIKSGKKVVSNNLNITWNGTSNSGKEVSSGTYFFQLKGRNFSEIKKIIFLK